MASVAIKEDSHLAGLPIICTVTPGNIQNATFQRARLKVTVTPSTGNTPGTAATFEFSTPLSGSTVDIDISSAVKAVADSFVPEAQVLSYRSYAVSLELYEDYMVEGQEHTTSGTVTDSVNTIYDGTLSDRNRFFTNWPAKWSLKPSTAEIAFVGAKTLVAGAAFSADGAGLTAPVITPTDVVEGLHGSIYGITAPTDGYEIRFINSLGVHENVFVVCLRQGEVGITTERYAISKQETLTDFSRGIALKKNNHERWKMSTYPLDYEWQQWYLHEFLMAQWAWVGIRQFANNEWSTKYLPVHILPDDTVKGIDRQKASPLTVEFTIEFDFNGSPY